MNFVYRNPVHSTLDSLFAPSGVDGVRGRSGLHERIVEGLTALISKQRDAGIEILRFPPVTNRAHIEKSGYLHSFPHLLGAVCCLQGDEAHIRNTVNSSKDSSEWVTELSPTDLVLTPAACYPLYPLVASRGPIPSAGLVFDVAADCFRHEPSHDIDRLQSFRMREFVRIGPADQVIKFRERWLAHVPEFVDLLGVKYHIDTASDPFFGRVGKIMAQTQLDHAMKFELLIPVRSALQPTACMSFNYHRDHFGAKWGLRMENGDMAHTGCVAFGIDRLALALFATHGLQLQDWPKHTREALAL